MTDKAKAAIATLENLGYTHEGGSLWKPPLGKAPDFNMLDSLRARADSLEDQLIVQANRAVIAEQQVTALTQRLDMANRLNTDARNQLAQQAAKLEWMDEEMRSQCNIHGMAAEREATRMTQNQRMHDRIAELEAQLSARQAAPDGWRLVPVEPTTEMTKAGGDVEVEGDFGGEQVLFGSEVKQIYAAMLSAAPPPPEREPLTDEQIMDLVRDECHEMRWPSTAISIFRAGERAHGIGATNDNL
ncbi:hypothetical protein [Comamonas sp. JUb58]|uniref:hypothetical protein n=1 Tax=Comamonas sp. JUb58 TaxID=2485114 RepID=UPI00106115C3|nr:hypothetical protein [Comamonas sp. JUb58]TDS70445.1 hypothetical protein EDF71_13133 [Comamonas sp. JUb58]